MYLHRLATNANLTRVCPVDTEDHPGDLRSSSPYQSRKTKNLAPPYLETDILKRPRACQVLHIKDHFSRLDVALGVERFQLATNHLANDLLCGQFRDRCSGHVRAVAKDSHTF